MSDTAFKEFMANGTEEILSLFSELYIEMEK